MSADPTQLQRAYYAATAQNYDEMHVRDDDEHGFALAFLIGCVGHFGFRSVLDIGSGTGRAMLRIKTVHPGLQVVGVEPSRELRAAGHAKGIPEPELMDGDAEHLSFPDGSFDVVCEFGALHHMRHPSRAVAEMLRVARRAVFISDVNNFGQGRPATRLVKQVIQAAGLWRVVDRIKTRGLGYTITEGDGLAYSYSVFSDLKQIEAACARVHMLNTRPASPNLYRTASHVAILGIKRA